MPELPEVESVVQAMNGAGVAGSRIESVQVFWPRSVGGDTRWFERAVTGQRIVGVSRRGKFIRLDLSRGAVLVHLRMSGMISVAPCGPPPRLHDRAILTLEPSRELRFHDPRKFGRMLYYEDPEERLGQLGPEPLDEGWGPVVLQQILGNRKRMIKPLLLDQERVAGLGNIYADEALWLAQVHPERRAGDLSPEVVARLAVALREVLLQGIRNGGTRLGSGMGNFGGLDLNPANQHALRVFRRAGLPCPRCGTTLERLIVGGRSSHVCPRCQRLR